MGPFIAALEAFVGGYTYVDLRGFGLDYWIFGRNVYTNYSLFPTQGTDYCVGSEGHLCMVAISHLGRASRLSSARGDGDRVLPWGRGTMFRLLGLSGL
jgi:hypothetical protein